jgi:hypothetical protein
MQGCAIGKETTASLFYQHYWDKQVEYGPYSEEGLSEMIIHDTEELLKMDSMILFSEIDGTNLSWYAFMNRKYPERFNPRLAELAFDQHFRVAEKFVITHFKDGNDVRVEALVASRAAQDLEYTKNKLRADSLAQAGVTEGELVQQTSIDELLYGSESDSARAESSN